MLNAVLHGAKQNADHSDYHWAADLIFHFSDISVTHTGQRLKQSLSVRKQSKLGIINPPATIEMIK